MSIQVGPIPGVPWAQWAKDSFPEGWLAVGGPQDGNLLPVQGSQVQVHEFIDTPEVQWYRLPRRHPEPSEEVAIRVHTYRHERLAFPPDLTWHVYVHADVTTVEAQRILFRRLLRQQPGVEQRRPLVGVDF